MKSVSSSRVGYALFICRLGPKYYRLTRMEPIETVKIDETVSLRPPAPSAPAFDPSADTMRFECKDSGLGGCEGKMRATGHGLYCTKHCNAHAAEWGKYPVSDDPLVQGDDDYARRHPKSKSRKSYGGA
jgi:hypothetical protein